MNLSRATPAAMISTPTTSASMAPSAIARSWLPADSKDDDRGDQRQERRVPGLRTRTRDGPSAA